MSTKFTDKFEKKSILDKLKDEKKQPITKEGEAEYAQNDEEQDSEEETKGISGGFTKRDKKNFMDHLISTRGDLCYKVVGRDITGELAWYYVLVDKEKKDAFLKHKPGDSYNIEDYGKIITSGYGEEVPEDVKEMLKEKYGFDNF
ncbi:MAG TPA: hypothetical protein DIV86_05145 [Alphaproteobacteria bacterium]|nr:hypothetical protein [Alphaproteobacteria bacterium]